MSVLGREQLAEAKRAAVRAATSPRAHYLLLAAYALALALWLLPNIPADDAAITFRYVDRFTRGLGLTYNDHEHVLGTSNPLYALVLSLVTLFTRDVESGALLVGVVSFVGTIVLAARLSGRISGSRLAGIAAGFLLASDPVYRYQCLSGMESCLAALLALLTADAILDERETAAGIFLGLAVWNKFDAALLALAVVAASSFSFRRLPIKTAVTSAAVALPWIVFATFYYGSPIPHSFTAKMSLQPRTMHFDRTWVWSFFVDSHHVLYAVITVLSLVLVRLLRLRRGEEAASTLLATWFGFHFTALSLIDLGAPYPWYLTVLMPPMIIVSCAALARLVVRVAELRLKAPLALGAMAVLWFAGRDSVAGTWSDLDAGDPLKPWEAFDGDRRLAGIFLSLYASPDEIVSNAYGWPAYASGMRFNDISLLNSVKMLEPTAYRIEHGLPADTGARGPGNPGDGLIPLATFNLASDLYPAYSWFTLFGRPDSYVARIGARYLQYRLYELPAPSLYSAAGLERPKLAGKDLLAPAPGGASFVVQNAGQPVHVAFAPTAPAGASAIFELQADDRPFYRRQVLPQEREAPVVVEVPEAQRRQTVRISFITEPGREADPAHAGATWKCVKVVVGDAFIDVWRLHNPRLAKAWSEHNPTGTSSRQDQIARLQARAY